MQNRYYVVYKAKVNDQVQEAATTIGLDAPIAFDSDIAAVTEHLAKQLGAETVLLISWVPLVGAQRPALEPAPSLQEQAGQVAEQIAARLAKPPKGKGKGKAAMAKPSTLPPRK